MKIAAIVPAYNEEERISVVLDAIRNAETIDEILVVSDGSTDGTSSRASTYENVRVIELQLNRGKGGAMREGAANTDADIVLFLDADLVGLTGEMVDAIARPVADDAADMAIGLFRDGRRATDLAQFITPYISGQRAMRREQFLMIPRVDELRSGVETAITKYYRARELRVSRVPLPGCTHHMKEEKLGLARGLASRLRMYTDIGRILLDGRDFR